MTDTRSNPGLDYAPTFIESVLQSPRAAMAVLLVALPLACWAWIVAMARDMYGPMTGSGRWMMASAWDAQHLLLLWAMWAVMMTGMMLPSAAPAIVLYGAAARRRHDSAAAVKTYALAAGYVSVWALFSVVATALQRALASQLLLSPMMELSNRAGAVVLIAAGAYQFTSLKDVCLRSCRSPFGFLIGGWRDGGWGAFRMGVDHGVHCVGCCAVLMLLLFAGGVMNLTVIAALTLFVAIEKLGLLGPRGHWISGAALVLLGGWNLFT